MALSQAVRDVSTIRVNSTRMLADLDALNTYGVDPGGGLSRLGFTPAEDDARRFLLALAADAKLHGAVDEAGNLFIHRGVSRPDEPVLLMGSHVDTVRNGGRFDGAYGVIAALEVLRTLTEHEIPTSHEPVVVAFSNEEGALFPAFWGSSAVAGHPIDPAAAVDRDGNSIREPLARAGGDLDAIARSAWRPGSMAAYLELHIEQGPVLESCATPIGIVSGITGRRILDITVSGSQNHAGTTPMNQRRDALVAAAHMVLLVEAAACDHRLCEVGTVGRLDVSPGQTNVVAGLVRATAEFRDLDADRLDRAESWLRAEFARLADERGVSIEVRTTMSSTPVRTAPALQAAIGAAADALCLEHRVIPSGAGHDAQIVAAIGPIGMIFVPSRGGISHAPEEHTDATHLVAGANVLLHTACRT